MIGLVQEKKNERRLRSFSEYRPLSTSDAEFLRDTEFTYRRRTRLKQLRMKERAMALSRRKLSFDSGPLASNDPSRSPLFRANWGERIQEASKTQSERTNEFPRNKQAVYLSCNGNKNYRSLSQNETSNLHQRRSLDGWPVSDNWGSSGVAKDAGFSKDFRTSLRQKPYYDAKSFGEEDYETTIATRHPQSFPDSTEYGKMNEAESSTLHPRFNITPHTPNQSMQDARDLKENDVIIIGEKAISAGYDEKDEAMKNAGSLSFHNKSIYENSQRSVIINRQETIRRLQRGERPPLGRGEAFIRTAKAYQSLPEVKERRKIEKRKQEAEHRRILVREMDARRRGKLR